MTQNEHWHWRCDACGANGEASGSPDALQAVRHMAVGHVKDGHAVRVWRHGDKDTGYLWTHDDDE